MSQSPKTDQLMVVLYLAVSGLCVLALLETPSEYKGVPRESTESDFRFLLVSLVYIPGIVACVVSFMALVGRGPPSRPRHETLTIWLVLMCLFVVACVIGLCVTTFCGKSRSFYTFVLLTFCVSMAMFYALAFVLVDSKLCEYFGEPEDPPPAYVESRRTFVVAEDGKPVSVSADIVPAVSASAKADAKADEKV